MSTAERSADPDRGVTVDQRAPQDADREGASGRPESVGKMIRRYLPPSLPLAPWMLLLPRIAPGVPFHQSLLGAPCGTKYSIVGAI